MIYRNKENNTTSIKQILRKTNNIKMVNLLKAYTNTKIKTKITKLWVWAVKNHPAGHFLTGVTFKRHTYRRFNLFVGWNTPMEHFGWFCFNFTLGRIILECTIFKFHIRPLLRFHSFHPGRHLGKVSHHH